jgi:hypothetical protein
MNLVFIEKVKENREAFAEKVLEISRKLDINPNWLMVLMNSESGLDHRIQNTKFPIQGGFATGLIQFAPNTAKGLGTSTEALRNMSNVEQLDWVYKYFAPYRNRIESFTDLYMVGFFPIALGKPDDWVFQAKGISAQAVAKSNPIFDLNKDGVLHKAEVEEAFLRRVPEHLREAFKKKAPTTAKGFCATCGRSL